MLIYLLYVYHLALSHAICRFFSLAQFFYVAYLIVEIVHVDSNSIDWHVSFSHLLQYPSANVDYTPRGPFQITFPTRSTRQEYTVNIIDDFLPENSEFFNANVNARPEDASIVVIRSPKQPLIEIQDLRDSKWLTALRYTEANYTYVIHHIHA